MAFDRLKYITEVTPGFGPEHPCPACKGDKYVPHVGEYETMYMIDGKEMRLCPLCRGSGVHRDRYTIMQREALAIFYDLLPEEGMLYPTITPGELKKLREAHRS